jgi:hypothetical protein
MPATHLPIVLDLLPVPTFLFPHLLPLLHLLPDHAACVRPSLDDLPLPVPILIDTLPAPFLPSDMPVSTPLPSLPVAIPILALHKNDAAILPLPIKLLPISPLSSLVDSTMLASSESPAINLSPVPSTLLIDCSSCLPLVPAVSVIAKKQISLSLHLKSLLPSLLTPPSCKLTLSPPLPLALSPYLSKTTEVKLNSHYKQEKANDMKTIQSNPTPIAKLQQLEAQVPSSNHDNNNNSMNGDTTNHISKKVT